MVEHCDKWTCPACGASVDVSMLGLYAQVRCPRCGLLGRAHETVGHFLITGVLGIGGMSVVYKARDLVLSRELAIKVLKDSYRSQPERMARFERECALMAKVRHNNVVALYSAGWFKNRFYIAMELIEGKNLEDCLQKERNGLPAMEALSIVRQAAEGLRAAGLAGMLHRDMKPGNILLTPAGEAKVLDFGLSLESADEKSREGVIWVTPFYVPPETLRMESEDIRSDIYALGMTLRSLLTGEIQFVPTPRGVSEILKAKQRLRSMMRMVPRKPLCRSLRSLVDRMTAMRPADRPASYDDLLQELDAVMMDQREMEMEGSGVARRFVRLSSLLRFAVPVLVGVLAAWFSYRCREDEKGSENLLLPLSPESEESLNSSLDFRKAVAASCSNDRKQAILLWKKLSADEKVEPALRAYAAAQLFALEVAALPHCSAEEVEVLWRRMEEGLPDDHSFSPAGRVLGEQFQKALALLSQVPSGKIVEELMQEPDTMKLPCLLYAASRTNDRELFVSILEKLKGVCEGENLASLYGQEWRERMVRAAGELEKSLAGADVPRREDVSGVISLPHDDAVPESAAALKIFCEQRLDKASGSERSLLGIRLEALELLECALEVLERYFPEADCGGMALNEAEALAQRIPDSGRFPAEFRTLVLIARGEWEEAGDADPYKNEPNSQAPFAVLARDWFQRRTSLCAPEKPGAGQL